MDFTNAFNHLKNDKIMSFLIDKFKNDITLKDRYESDFSKAIALLIIEQQVSFKAAITIKKRFIELISDKTPLQIVEIDNDVMQSIGISYRKVDYIKNTYLFFLNNKTDFQKINKNEVIKELTKIKGVGKWTSEMFLIFILFKKNIFSKGDLALINSIKVNYSISQLSDQKLDSLIKKWSPYNTIASLLLWKSIEEKVFYKKMSDK
jgi:3-methyladenine DNA glycosylase/8-oxoguanine DNA glycosylase|tara:strand:+ start:422 stop:1039 length:618 start_codon:yes stop_codon:yes gene_type:complete